MQCPCCDKELKEKKVGAITVDVCEGGCGGIWFDNFELKKVDEEHEHEGEELLNIKRKEGFKIDPKVKRECPRCQDTFMMKHFVSIKREAEIDECGKCAGVWLDVGELASIRNAYKTEKERSLAFDSYFKDVFGDEVDLSKAKNEAELARARKFAHMFRFLCPSYYIPGKQSWGAF